MGTRSPVAFCPGGFGHQLWGSLLLMAALPKCCWLTSCGPGLSHTAPSAPRSASPRRPSLATTAVPAPPQIRFLSPPALLGLSPTHTTGPQTWGHKQARLQVAQTPIKVSHSPVTSPVSSSLLTLCRSHCPHRFLSPHRSSGHRTFAQAVLAPGSPVLPHVGGVPAHLLPLSQT